MNSAMFSVIFFILKTSYSLGLQQTGNVISENAAKSDFFIGGYFGVHSRVSSGICGEIKDSGLYLVEAMRYAIQKINADPSKLFNITIGYRIADTCGDVKTLRWDIASMILAGKLLGVVGPATSDEAILASSVFGIFHQHLVSYSATSISLQDREKYFNFYRTVPSDDLQSRAIRDILKHFNWTYISTVSSYGNYGQRGIARVIKLAESSGICIATRNSLPKLPNVDDYVKVIKNLNKDQNARAVVLFTTAEDTRGILTAARSSKVNFTWISSSAWTADFGTVRGIEADAKGSILVNYADINNEEFSDNFKEIKYENNKYSWFKEFWEDSFNCSLVEVANMTRCYGNESISNSNFYGKYAATQAVIDAVHILGYAFRCTVAHFCKVDDEKKRICASRLPNPAIRQGMSYFIFSRQTRCKDAFKRVSFDENGTVYRNIEFLNFDGKEYKSMAIWEWNSTTKRSKLDFKNINITWAENELPISICSKPCNVGERKVISKTKECCFTCHPCQRDEFLMNNTCFKCEKYHLPDDTRKMCVKLEKLEVKITDYLSVIIIAESTIGFALNSVVLFLFMKHKESKIVKSSSRELSFFMLAGLYLCFISPCIFLLNPTMVRCGLRRFIFGLSFTACYTPLMLKTNRIYRIFRAASSMVSMPHFVSPASQILIYFGLLGLQLLLSIMWVVGDPPVVTHFVVDKYKMVADLCGENIFKIIINLIPCFCMLAASTFFAFKSRKFSKNYNEAYNIGITMYLSCALWSVFIPLLLFIEVHSANPFSRIYLIGNFTNVIGLVSLAGLFGPKVWRLVFLITDDSSQEVYSSVCKTNSLENSIELSNMVKRETKNAQHSVFIKRKTSRRKSF